ncbi:MAG: pilus assembly protein [Caldilineae bacterium]|nr:MAG: pilus assembly protein [Caldilineae bacterium]
MNHSKEEPLFSSKIPARGQSLVELAITLPFLLILFLGMTEVGYYMYATIAVHNTAREAARVAAKEPQFSTNTIDMWASKVMTDVLQSASASFLAPSGKDDTVIVTHLLTDSSGTITTCESKSAIWPDTGAPGADTSRFTCADLQTLINQMPSTIGSGFEQDEFILVEYYHHHYPIIGLTVVMPQGVELYSYTVMRVIGQ